jgi:nitrate/nitrite transporter NarK
MATNDQASTAELLRRLTEQSSELARKEVELAKAEMTIKAKRFGMGAGAFGGAGLLGVFAFAALTAGLILLLATAVDDWLAAVIVAVAYAAVAGVLALLGKRKVDEATPPVPEHAIESTKADVQEARERVQEARR